MDTTIGLTHIPFLEACLRLGAAALFGLLLGIDREMKHKPIGMRAYMLVAVGSAAFSIITLEIGAMATQTEGISDVDVARVVQGIIGGIGFLGAGAIIQSGSNIKGTGTGAAIWCVGAVGLACGFGLYAFGAAVTLLSLTILVGIGALRQRFSSLKDDD